MSVRFASGHATSRSATMKSHGRQSQHPGPQPHRHPAEFPQQLSASSRRRALGALSLPGGPELWVSHPKVAGGAPVFAHSSVPVETLLVYREAGCPLYEFLFDFRAMDRRIAKRFWAWMALHHPEDIRAALRAATVGHRPGLVTHSKHHRKD